MGKRKRTKLSVKRRILLHLLKFSRAYVDEWEVPHALSQEGIADALDILLNNVSRALKGLMEADLVDPRLCHIEGVKRRRKAYFLTPEGSGKAKDLRSKVKKDEVQVVEPDGNRRAVTVEELIDRFRMDFGHSIDVTDVIETVRRNGVFDLEKVSLALSEVPEGVGPRPSYVDMTDEAPKLTDFFGREEVLTRITECIGGEGPPVIVIYGMAGIGKTSLALKVLDGLRGKRHLLYHRCHTWDSISNVISVLVDFLRRMGCRSKALSGEGMMDLNELGTVLSKELPSREVLLVFDDLHRAREELKPLFRLLVDLSGRFSDSNLIFLSREIPDIYTRRDVKVNRIVEEISLGELDISSSREMLGRRYGEGEMERIYQLSGGIPLFLEIIGSIENVDAVGDIHRYIEEEIFSDLEEGQRRVLERLSVHRLPVAPEAALGDDCNYDDLSVLCNKSLVMEMPGKRFEAHDLIREFVYERMASERKRRTHQRAAAFYWDSLKEDTGILYFSEDLLKLESVHHEVASGNEARAAEKLLAVGPGLLLKGYTEVGDILETIGPDDLDEETWADILIMRGDAAAAMDDWETALDRYEEALSAMKKEGGDRSTLATLHGMIGKAQMHVEKWEETIGSHRDAMAIFEEAGDKRGISRELINLGMVHRKRGEWEQAKKSYERARRYLEELDDERGQVVLYNNLALLHRDRGDLRGARRSIEKGLDLAERCGDELGKAVVLYTRGEIEVTTGNMVDGWRDMGTAADLFRSGKEFDSAIRVYLDLGDSMCEENELEKGMRTYLKALDVYQLKRGRGMSLLRKRRGTEDHQTLGEIYDRLSSVTMDRGELEQSLRYNRKAIDALEQAGDRSGVARKLLDLGLMFEESGDHHQARRSMSRAVETLRDTGELKGTAVIHLNLARVLERMGDIERALKHLDRARELARDLGDDDLERVALEAMDRIERGG